MKKFASKVFTVAERMAFYLKSPFWFSLLRKMHYADYFNPYELIHDEYIGRSNTLTKLRENQATQLFTGQNFDDTQRQFIYVGPKAFERIEELQNKYPSSTFIFPKFVANPATKSVFFLNEEEKEIAPEWLNVTFSNVISGARKIETVPWFVMGWPLGLLRTIYNIWALYGQAQIYVVGVDFYTGRTKHSPSYLAKSSIRKPVNFRRSMLKHDVILNFWVARCLWRQGLISGDNDFVRVMSMDIPAFTKIFFRNI